MKDFIDIIFFIPCFEEREIENYDDIDKHEEDGLKITLGLMIWAGIVMIIIGLINH